MTNSQRYDKWFADYTSASKQEQYKRVTKVLQLAYLREMRELLGKHVTSITILVPKD